MAIRRCEDPRTPEEKRADEEVRLLAEARRKFGLDLTAEVESVKRLFGGPTLKFEADLIQADVPTVNGNVYSREVLERVRDQINDMPSRKLVMNFNFVPPTGRVSLTDAVGVIDEAELTDTYLLVRGALVDERLIEYMHASDVSIKAFGYGTVASETQDPRRAVVADDYKLECVYVVRADEHHEPNVRWEPVDE